jgi:hypothetical protein
MVAYISQCLIGFFCNFPKAIAFKEVKFESAPLLFRELASKPIQQGSGIDVIGR